MMKCKLCQNVIKIGGGKWVVQRKNKIFTFFQVGSHPLSLTASEVSLNLNNFVKCALGQFQEISQFFKQEKKPVLLWVIKLGASDQPSEKLLFISSESFK